MTDLEHIESITEGTTMAPTIAGDAAKLLAALEWARRGAPKLESFTKLHALHIELTEAVRSYRAGLISELTLGDVVASVKTRVTS